VHHERPDELSSANHQNAHLSASVCSLRSAG
jgi:hypothetical protein